MEILKILDVSKNYFGLKAVNKLSFTLNKGEILSIIGPNGAGKTTTFNLITGFTEVTEGKIFLNNLEITNMPPHIIAKKGVSRTFQQPQLFSGLSVLENVMIPNFMNNTQTRVVTQNSIDILERVGLQEKMNVRAESLNLAERKKLELAKVLSLNPSIILLDEMMAGVRESEMEDLISIIKSLKQNGVSIIVIEHIMQIIEQLSDRILVLHHGEVISEGEPNTVLTDPLVLNAYLGEEIEEYA